MFGQLPFNPNQNMYFPNQTFPNMNNMNNMNNDNILDELNRKIKDLENRVTKIEKRLNMYGAKTEYDYQNSMYMM